MPTTGCEVRCRTGSMDAAYAGTGAVMGAPENHERRRWARHRSAAPPQTAVERKAQEQRAAYRRKRRLLRLGQVLMAASVAMGILHVVTHLGVFGGQPSGWVDLLAGYPMAGVLFVAGAIAAGQ